MCEPFLLFKSSNTFPFPHYCYKVLRKLPYFLIDSFRATYPLLSKCSGFYGYADEPQVKRMLWSLRMPRGWCDFIMRKIVLSPMEERVPLRLTQGAFNVNGWWAPKARWIQYWHRRKQRKYGTTQFPTCQRFGDVATCGKKNCKKHKHQKFATQLTTPREGKWLERFCSVLPLSTLLDGDCLSSPGFCLDFGNQPHGFTHFWPVWKPHPASVCCYKKIITRNSASSFFHRQLKWPKPRSVSKIQQPVNNCGQFQLSNPGRGLYVHTYIYIQIYIYMVLVNCFWVCKFPLSDGSISNLHFKQATTIAVLELRILVRRWTADVVWGTTSLTSIRWTVKE